jgi:hypothetical protein
VVVAQVAANIPLVSSFLSDTGSEADMREDVGGKYWHNPGALSNGFKVNMFLFQDLFAVVDGGVNPGRLRRIRYGRLLVFWHRASGPCRC